MISLPHALAILAFAATTSLANPAGVPNYIRLGIGGGRVPHGGDDNLAPADRPDSDDITTISPASNWGAIVDDHPINPTADEIAYAPASQRNTCLRSEQCHEVLEVAIDVMEKIIDAASGGSPTSTRSAWSFPTYTGVSNSSRTGPRRTFLPNGDQAILIANDGVDEEYMGLLSSEEQTLYLNSPICFFANLERMYSSAAAQASAATNSASRTATSESSTIEATATITSSPDRRRDDILGPINECQETTSACQDSTSTLATSATASLQSAYFISVLPSRLESIYAAATSSGLETTSTTCSGFGAGQTFTASFVQKAAVTTNATPTGQSTELTGDANLNDVKMVGLIAGFVFAGFGAVLL